MNTVWGSTTIGEISELITKGTTPTSVGFKFEDNGVSFVKVESLTADGKFIQKKLARINNVCHKALKRSQLKAGDILFSIAGALGRTALVVPDILPANTNQALAIIRLKSSDEVVPEYVLLALSSGMLLEQIEKKRGGVAQQNLSLSQVKNFEIPLPPLPEQKRIVVILDEVFTGISQAVANAEKNLANARELFESYLNNIFTQKGEGWEERRLGDLTEVQSGGTPLRSKPEYWSGDIAWFSSGELNDIETQAPNRTITLEGINNSNAKLFPKGSLLIGMYDTAALKMSIIDRDAAFNQAISGMKPSDGVNLIFVLHAVNAIKPEVLSLRRGVRQKNLSLGKIKDIVISIPKYSEQQFIVNKLATIEREVSLLETCYQQKLEALTELKQSILQKAFSGELTAEDDTLMDEAVVA